MSVEILAATGAAPGSAGSFSKINLPTGAAGAAGTATLAGGTVTVSTTAVTASSIIVATYHTPAGATQGVKLAIPTRTAATSFVIRRHTE